MAIDYIHKVDNKVWHSTS